MNDLKDLVEAIGPIVMIVITIFMYIFVVQIVNDATCAAMDRHAPLGNNFIKLIALC